MAGDRAFYPLNKDTNNHVSLAKIALELSKFDQQNLQLKIEEWKTSNPDFSFFFWPYKITLMLKGHHPFQMKQMKHCFMFSKKAGRKAN